LEKEIKIIWIHTFNSKHKNSGIFMFEYYNYLISQKQLFIELAQMPSFYKIYNLLKFYLKYSKSKTNVIHSQYGSFCGFFASFLPGKKIITLRGSDIIRIREGNLFEKIHSRLAVLMTNLSLKRYEKILVMSNDMVKYIHADYVHKVIVHTDPLDFNKFLPLDKLRCRKKHFTSYSENDFKLVLFTSINRNNPIKRYYLAEDAVKFANNYIGYEAFKLVTAHEINHSEMCEIYNSVDMVILTSTHEGWPNCIKEALACNVPFVSTNVSDLLFLDLPNCYVTNDSAKELAQSLLNINTNCNHDLRSKISYLDFANSKNELIELYKN